MEEHISGQPQQEEKDGITGNSAEGNEPEANGAAEVLMDYGQLAGEDETHPPEPAPPVSVGLTGGQAKDDDRGLDISQYTGPQSKPSSSFNDPEAPYHTGPGNGLSSEEGTPDTEWENPEPENDSF